MRQSPYDSTATAIRVITTRGRCSVLVLATKERNRRDDTCCAIAVMAIFDDADAGYVSVFRQYFFHGNGLRLSMCVLAQVLHSGTTQQAVRPGRRVAIHPPVSVCLRCSLRVQGEFDVETRFMAVTVVVAWR